MNAGTGTRRRAGAALLAAATYLTFLVAGAPHRVHHFFDFLETPGTAAAAPQPSPDEAGSHSHHYHAHAHDHHGHGGGTDGHGHHDTSPETAPEPPCVVLAAFEQNPGSFADPAVHSMDRPALALSFGSVSGPPRAARIQTHHSRAPPHLT
ncbi:MAG: hypothetical protein OXK82_10165 [Deltaproteobacteria bacterium]|nr:hypothetical protein [Deltaproteobacteria bacterium]